MNWEQFVKYLKDKYGSSGTEPKVIDWGWDKPGTQGYVGGEGANAKFVIPQVDPTTKQIVPNKYQTVTALELAAGPYKEVGLFNAPQSDKGYQIGFHNGQWEYFASGPNNQPVWTGAIAPTPATAVQQQQRILFPQEIAKINSDIAVNDAQIRQIDASIKNAQNNYDLAVKNQQWLQTKDTWAQETADKTLQLQTQQALFNQDNAVTGLQLQMLGLQARRDEAQANLDQSINTLNTNTQNSINQFNATMQFNVDQANEKAKQDRLNRLQSLASSIAEAAKAPGDWGKLAALTLANSGWGQAVTAIAKGADLRTAQSLAPTESLLRTREEVLASPEKPFTYSPLQAVLAPGVKLPGLGGITMPGKTVGAPSALPVRTVPTFELPGAKPTAAGGGAETNAGGASGGSGAGITFPGAINRGTGAPGVSGQQAIDYLNWEVQQQGGYPSTSIQGLTTGVDTSNPIYSVADSYSSPFYTGPLDIAAPSDVPGYNAGLALLQAEAGGNYARGGVANGAYISGERGPELNIPFGDKTIVLNQKQMKAAGIDLKALMNSKEKPQQFADGGIFDAGWGNVQDQDRTLSMQFLNDALARARAGTPFQEGALPAPVYASTPGFSPLVTQVLGSLTSMAQGVPTEYFQELAAKYRPSGIRESVTQRSA